MVDAPISNKFLHLKSLNIVLTRDTFSLSYDYLSLTSFLDASPSLETFILEVSYGSYSKHTMILTKVVPLIKANYFIFRYGNYTWSMSQLPPIPRIQGRCLDTTMTNSRTWGSTASPPRRAWSSWHAISFRSQRRSSGLYWTPGKGLPCLIVLSTKSANVWVCQGESILEARRALVAVQTYIKPKVPSTVQFRVLEPCSRCHVVDDH